MATYKTDRDRNYGFVGKFKFSYTVRFIDSFQTGFIDFRDANVAAGAYIKYKIGDEKK